MKDEQLNLEEIEASHTLGGAESARSFPMLFIMNPHEGILGVFLCFFVFLRPTRRKWRRRRLGFGCYWQVTRRLS